MVSIVLLVPISIWITSVIFYVGCKALRSALRYRQVLSVVAYAYLGYLVIQVLGSSAVLLFTNLHGAPDPTGLFPVNLAFLVNAASLPALHTALAALDLVTLYYFCLLFTGFAVSDDRVNRTGLGVLTAVAWAIFALPPLFVHQEWFFHIQ
jgi:hypothetical protein